jgi:dihydroorotate dehydrogenase electron transfer subunit
LKTEKMEIISNKKIADNIFELVIKGELTNEVKGPGQFFHVKVGEGSVPLLRRPISLCHVDRNRKEVSMIYRADGEGTRQLAKAGPGMTLDVLGPLGNGFSTGNEQVPPSGRALIVGGGVGVPPLYLLSKTLVAKGVQVTHVLGFQTDSVVFYEEKFKELGPTFIATVDGTRGTKGFVTDVIDQEGLSFDIIYTCGPLPMLKALETKYGEDYPVFLSLEERMGCGIGACLACVCHTQDDPSGAAYRKVCTDGPVFKAGEVVL